MVERAPRGALDAFPETHPAMQEETEKSAATAAVLSADERGTLLRVARDAIVAHLERRPSPPLDGGTETPRLLAPGAAFVTVRVQGDLRGCIGTTRFERPLREVVSELAVSAANQDRRFDSIRGHELARLTVAVSVLTPLEPARVDAIEIGRHGLVVRWRSSSGLLLPQVASENGWDAARFLAETSRKAGLPQDAWRQPGAQVFWFEAERFSEDGLD
ncbi:MAG: AmmeMemoRadiSam system protein A [Planctomycetota bacterium]